MDPNADINWADALQEFLNECQRRWETYIENLAIAAGEDQGTDSPAVQWAAVEDRFEDWAHGLHPDDLYPDMAVADVVDEMGSDQDLLLAMNSYEAVQDALMALLTA